VTEASDDPGVVVENADALVQRLGRWPSFHDAEVVRLVLDREGVVLDLQIKVALSLAETDAAGYFKLENPTLVTFRFSDIDELEVRDFNQQNVITGLSFEIADDRIRVVIDPMSGLGGVFSCDRIEVVDIVPLEAW
jgi:Immunity protein 50